MDDTEESNVSEPNFTDDEFDDEGIVIEDFTDEGLVDEERAGERDPGADVDTEGIPEVADESTPGTGDAPEPELPATPNEVPGAVEDYGTTAWEQAHPEGIDERVGEEVPDDLEFGETGAVDGAAPENAALHIEDDTDADIDGS